MSDRDPDLEDFATLTIILVFGVIVPAKLWISSVHSAAEELSVAPRTGGVSGTYLTMPPANCMLRIYLETLIGNAIISSFNYMTYWSKKGSNTMTSWPGSMKAIMALSIPSFAPVVMDTSVSGSICLPKYGL